MPRRRGAQEPLKVVAKASLRFALLDFRYIDVFHLRDGTDSQFTRMDISVSKSIAMNEYHLPLMSDELSQNADSPSHREAAFAWANA